MLCSNSYCHFLPRMDVFMPLVINVIHYNSSFLDEDIVSGIVRLASNVILHQENPSLHSKE